jgi:transcriptional repressor NrdR
MKCPYCGHGESKVTDSRTADDGIRRRRECMACGVRFTTYERVQSAEIYVVKRDGRREQFNREKLLSGIRKALEKRPLAATAADDLANQIETILHVYGRPEVSSGEVGDLVMDGLRELDEIAYIRFASVYRSFADVEELREELESLKRANERKRMPNQLSLLPEEDMKILAGANKVLPLRSRRESADPLLHLNGDRDNDDKGGQVP